MQTRRRRCRQICCIAVLLTVLVMAVGSANVYDREPFSIRNTGHSSFRILRTAQVGAHLDKHTLSSVISGLVERWETHSMFRWRQSLCKLQSVVDSGISTYL